MNVETALDLLRHPRRRAVVSILDETDSISRQQLVARLAAADAEIGDGESGDGKNRDGESRDAESTNEGTARAIGIALHHNHLPRLADADVVEYDDDTVTATPKLETVVEYATVIEEEPANTRHRLGARLSRFYA